MWFMMIVGIIFTAIGLSRMVDPYTPQALIRAFGNIAVAAFVLGLIGLIRLEPRYTASSTGAHSETYSLKQMAGVITRNPVGRSFFVYLFLLLAAILGQDILLEPFAAESFGMTVTQTTRITSLWGTFVLIAIIFAGWLEGRAPRRLVVQSGNLGALGGFLIILLSGLLGSLNVFYLGVILLGIGTGIATVSNLSLMFDLTVPGEVGLYMGAWGVSNALSRLAGSVLGGAVRDAVGQISGSSTAGYLAVFGIEALMLFAAVLLLSRIDASAFHRQASAPSYSEKVALAAE
jgi:BCD family chlorophyll transporter-like MFS transporter